MSLCVHDIDFDRSKKFQACVALVIGSSRWNRIVFMCARVVVVPAQCTRLSHTTRAGSRLHDVRISSSFLFFCCAQVVFDPIEKMWVMYHIGAGTPNGPAQNCTHTSSPSTSSSRSDRDTRHITTTSSGGANRVGNRRVGHSLRSTGPTSAAPFELHFSPSLNGPWQTLKVGIYQTKST